MIAQWSVACSALFGLFALANSLELQQCPGNSISTLNDDVSIVGCSHNPCRLKKGTTQHITFKFRPEKNYKSITTKVTANLGGFNLPFVGVDGTSVCDKLYSEDGQKESCPVTAGRTYLYKDSFPVYDFYPDVTAVVHWALQNNQKDISCFEVGVKIK